MFPVTHIWFGERVLGKLNNMGILGTIFPDMVISGCFSHEETHRAGWKLFDFLVSKDEYFRPFALGTITHGVNPTGLDYFGDEKFPGGEKGYCFQKAEIIKNKVIEACNIPEEFGLWKGHNFIEMAIEMEIYDKNIDIDYRMKSALADKYEITKISRALAEYYLLNSEDVSHCIDQFGKYVELENPSSSSLAFKYDLQMIKKHGISIDIKKSTKIIEESREIIKEDIFDFFDFAENEVKKIIKNKGDFEKNILSCDMKRF